MQNNPCPACGRETAPDAACPGCGHAATNGAAAQKKWIKPPPPPELAGRVFEPVPAEIVEEFHRTFNEEEFWAEFHEAMQSGGADMDALIAEIKQKVHGQT